MPFFEPLVIDLLIERYPKAVVWFVIDCIFKICELTIAGCIYLLWFQKILRKKRLTDKIDVLFILHLLFMIISCLLQMDFAISFFGSTFCAIALIPLSEYMIQKSEKDFLMAGKALFGFWSIYAIMTAFIFPNGFGVSSTKYDAIFGLGAKNNAFPFFFTYTFFIIANKVKANKRLPLSLLLICSLMIMAANIYSSKSTMICIGFVLCVFLLEKSKSGFFKHQNVFLWLIVLASFVTMIYARLNMHIIESVLIKFGRNSTFSHRDVIWSHAISYLRNSPIWGAGASIEYRTVWPTIKVQQAHSQYLDKLAKFGLVSFSFLVLVLIKLFGKIRQCNNFGQINILAIMVLIYMIHMAFDTYNYNFFIIIFITLNSFIRQNICIQKGKNE